MVKNFVNYLPNTQSLESNVWITFHECGHTECGKGNH